MNIILIGPVFPYRGGIAHYTSMLAKALCRKHQVKVISYSRQYPKWLYPGETDKDPSKAALTTEAEFSIDSINPLSWIKTALQIAKDKPDLLILQWWVTFWAPAYTLIAWYARRKNIPVIFTIHNVLPHEGHWIHRPLTWITLRQGTKFIVHTEKELHRLKNVLPGAAAIVTSFPIYDELASTDLVKKEEAQQKLQVPNNAFVLLFFGIVRPYKGLGFLIDAIGILVKRGLNMFLIVAGEFWEEKSKYLEQIEKLKLQNHILIQDRYIPNEELSLFFSAADVVVAPYIDGTQSAVAALALGFGIPLITTEQGGAGINADHAAYVLKVPSKNAEALANAILSIMYEELIPSRKEIPLDKDEWASMNNAIENLFPHK